jgi:hypothetical protein
MFAQKYPHGEGKNEQYMEKNDNLTHTIKQEMGKIIDNTEEFYDLLNKRVTGPYRVVPGPATNVASKAHQTIASPPLKLPSLPTQDLNKQYEESMLTKQQEIVKSRLAGGADKKVPASIENANFR